MIRKYSNIGIVLAIVCILLSVFAFSFNAVNRNGSTALIYDVNSMLEYAIAAVSIYLFRRLLWSEPFKFSIVEAVVAAIFAVLTILGFLLDSAGVLSVSSFSVNNATVENRIAVAGVLYAMTLGFFLFYYAATDWLFCNVAKLRKKVKASDKPPTFFKHELTFPLCAGLMLIAWLPYIIYFFPGTVTTDTSHHLAQLLGDIELTTHFPYLPGLIESKLYQFGLMLEPTGTLGIFFMGVIQIILGLFVFSTVVMWLKRLNMPNWLTYGALIFFALFPLVPIYMIQVSKDTLHSEFVVLFVLQLLLFCLSRRKDSDNPRKVPPPSLIYSPWMIALVGLFVSLTRNNGIIMVVFALLVCLILYRNKMMALASVALCVCFGLWQFMIVPACGVKSAGYTEACSMQAQVVAACLQDGALLSEDQQVELQNCFTTDLSTVAARYVPACADTVKAVLNLSSMDGAISFTGIAASLAVTHPVTALSAALNTTYESWYPFCKGSFHSEDSPYVTISPGDWPEMDKWYPNMDAMPAFNDSKQPGIHVTAFFHYLPIVSMFYSPGFYCWFIILLIGFALKTKSNRKMTATVLGPFVALWLIMVLGPCASLRYTIPAIFTLPLFVVITINTLPSKEKTRSESEEI